MALTASQLDHYRRILTQRRDELAAGTVRAEAEVQEQDDLAHLDFSDRAVSTTAKEDLLQEAGRDSETLAQIETALRRIEAGTFGTCDECGREIPQARLDAVPWATLCVRDQEISDERRRAAGVMSGGAPSRVVS